MTTVAARLTVTVMPIQRRIRRSSAVPRRQAPTPATTVRTMARQDDRELGRARRADPTETVRQDEPGNHQLERVHAADRDIDERDHPTAVGEDGGRTRECEREVEPAGPRQHVGDERRAGTPRTARAAGRRAGSGRGGMEGRSRTPRPRLGAAPRQPSPPNDGERRRPLPPATTSRTRPRRRPRTAVARSS